MFEITDTQKIGVGLAGFGVFFLFLGVLLLFDKSLLALGNILFICGLGAVIGAERTFRFFFQRHKVKGSMAFFGGIVVVLIGWPVCGMIVETYGFVILFSELDMLELVDTLNDLKFLSDTFSGFKKAKNAPTTKVFIEEKCGRLIAISGFFPVAINFLRRVPLLGTVLNLPGIGSLVDRLAGDSNRTTV